MKDNDDKPADAPEAQPGTPPADPSPPTEKTFTQEEVNALTAKAASKGKRAGKREAEAATAQPTTPDPKPEAPPSDMAAELAKLNTRLDKSERDRAFAEQLAKHPNASSYTDLQLDILRGRFDPEDPTKMADTAHAFGAPANPQATPPQAPASGEGDPPNGTATPYQAPGAPAGAPQEPSSSPLDWSADDVSRLRADGTFLKKVEEWRMRTEGAGNAVWTKRKPGG